jgi:hypothetical protein
MVRRREAPSRTMRPAAHPSRRARCALLRMRSVGAAYLPPKNIPTPIASTLKNIAAVDSQPSQYNGPAIT